MSRPRTASVLVPIVFVLAACGGGTEVGTSAAGSSSVDPAEVAGVEVVVHKTASCECCGRYEEYLEDLGFTVTQEVYDDVSDVKDALGVPLDERSCHTNEVGGYAAEGHVPAEALLALLDQQPDVGGISLAGMPPGSPGMPGEQTEPFVVQTFTDGVVVGTLGEF